MPSDDVKELLERIDELQTSRCNLALAIGLVIGTLDNAKNILQDCIKDDIPVSTSPMAKVLLDALGRRHELLNQIIMKEFCPESIPPK